MRLRVSIGSGSKDMTTAWVNVEDKPTEIDSDFWVGRVLVRVKDFDGFTPDGTPPATHSPYFEGRNRRFHIQAEGRFKKQYNGDQVWFGTQFDHMIGNFPETLFNAGMRIAKYIDPAVFYDKGAERPYIMSPYLACVNTLSAWPAPHRSHDAVLALENGNAQTESDDEHAEDDVPREEARHSKKDTQGKAIRYWSFQGFREDEGSNMLQRAYTRDEDHPQTPALPEVTEKSSIRTHNSKFDEERALTAEHPGHRVALTRLGSYGREVGAERRSLLLNTDPALDTFEEENADDFENDDDDASFHTAAEYIIEDEVQPDGSVVPVKKKKKGLSVKKVRKSLHIPSAKTVQKNMRGLSIKRKDKGDKRTDSADLSDDITPRNSQEIVAPRKSLDLMRPFRFGHHEKDPSSTTRHSSQVDRVAGGKIQAPISSTPSVSKSTPATTSAAISTIYSSNDIDIGDRSMLVTAGRSATEPLQRAEDAGISSAGLTHKDTPTSSPRENESLAHRTVAPTRVLGNEIDEPQPLKTTSNASMNSSEVHPTAMQSIRSLGETPLQGPERRSTDRSSQTGQSTSSSNVSRHPSKTQNTTEIRGDALVRSTSENDGLSHALDERLGPWRFSNPKIEPIEDTAFIFGDTAHSVKDRRKFFAKSVDNRTDFDFDPDIVYCMSFFLPYMNFNTFDLKLGPLGANLHKYVDDQPLRYMARSSERPDEIFFMVEFALE